MYSGGFAGDHGSHNGRGGRRDRRGGFGNPYDRAPSPGMMAEAERIALDYGMPLSVAIEELQRERAEMTGELPRGTIAGDLCSGVARMMGSDYPGRAGPPSMAGHLDMSFPVTDVSPGMEYMGFPMTGGHPATSGFSGTGARPMMGDSPSMGDRSTRGGHPGTGNRPMMGGMGPSMGDMGGMSGNGGHGGARPPSPATLEEARYVVAEIGIDMQTALQDVQEMQAMEAEANAAIGGYQYGPRGHGSISRGGRGPRRRPRRF